ncbi:type I phosphodiesterase/nucleotide pyrophosphatase (macronuclear) [Tetrahymena thermophila SB210]|uniref:Type I phosphodiesterase/nucleotide pyrophosphatase n=1 Tax=Tetrahymena thermophila (strain SB210) TaxID=312017 RepID=Q22KD4_TETTS|nr:type I phosphodiesterase/nucleotide pyrophosphatase [Tetrahymena thermophila SB210]EAR85865.2 type I phosphodiesterase/nucleotide pyrophosphatase [Tetrahymena thermophila SB210]|eukprot:XP_001033528.2 type I phosphodiesterase/nucleotide pyrophosphatase [Tetrahymena thermophila SB210]
MFKLNRAVKQLVVKSVLTSLIAITSIQAILFYKTLSFVFLKEDILKKSTTNAVNPFLEDQKSWLVGTSDDKMLFIVIDTLGYYLAKPNLSILSQIQEKEPNNTIYLKAKTDSLTVTGPRLLSLMTGTNPTIMDLIQNVEHSEEIKIDNIPSKMKAANKTIYFIGDDTWVKLFPTSFTYFTDMQSFNIFSNGREDEHMINQINKWLDKENNNEDPVDMIISHFLGMDHIIHSTNDIHSSNLAQEYDLFNKFIEDLINNQPNRTIVICSDHGVSLRASHGGDSQEETETFFFVYRKKGFAKNQPITQQLMADIPNYPINNLLSRVQCNQSDKKQQCGQFEGMLQVDVAINLSNILGLSIPYSSLGMVWPIFNNQYKEGDTEEESKFKDTVARNTYTALKQQISYVMENQVYKDKIGEKNIFNFLSQEKVIDELYKEFLKDNTVQKLKILFEKCFDLNEYRQMSILRIQMMKPRKQIKLI